MLLSIPEPLSVCSQFTVIVFVVDVPVGAVFVGAVSSFQIAYSVIVSLFVVVRFVTVCPGVYVGSVALESVDQPFSVYPGFVIPASAFGSVAFVSYVAVVFAIVPVPVFAL